MKSESRKEIENFISQVLEDLDLLQVETLSEKLDSLHRLFIVEKLEGHFFVDFSVLLITPSHWIDQNTLVRSVNEIIGHGENR
jgi:hypothetical protein